MKIGQKHLIKCRCVLQQFKRQDEPPSHQFVVFSIIDENGDVVPKLAQCNNCNVIHRVTDLTRSEVVFGKEVAASIVTIDDVRGSLPENLAKILETNQADLPTWEATQFAYENKQWGQFIVMTTEADGVMRQGKYVKILGENMFKVEPFERDEVFK